MRNLRYIVTKLQSHNFGAYILESLVEQDLQKLSFFVHQEKILPEDSEELVRFLDRYFGEHGRNPIFRRICLDISPRFSEFLSHFDLTNGTAFASRFFLFSYTLLGQDAFISGGQNEIYTNVALPFQKWVEDKGENFNNLINEIEEGADYVFICRRAITSGLYAPGKSIYTYVKTLLERGEDVWVIALWAVDDKFLNLQNQYSKLRISALFRNNLDVNLIAVIEILKLVKPKVIITETEFELPSILAILNKKIPMIYMAQGYYNVPWYDRIGYSTDLGEKHKGRQTEDFFDTPFWISRDISGPKCDERKLADLKQELGLKHHDFVIGSFAQMQKFSEPFLEFLNTILRKEISLKVLLAGPGDDSLVRSKLIEFIGQGRAIILPTVDVNLVGYCLDLGIDTFPSHSGYSVLELMAKNIPVLAKKDVQLGITESYRLPETLMSTEAEISELISELIHDKAKLAEYKNKTDEFMKLTEKSDLFLEVLDSSLNKLRNRRLRKEIETQLAEVSRLKHDLEKTIESEEGYDLKQV